MKISALMSAAVLAAALVPSVHAQQNAPAVEGVLIKNVVANSAAARIGLQPGDRITAIDGAPTVDAFDMAWAIGSHQPGSQLSLQVMRNGKTIELQGMLGRSVRTNVVMPATMRRAPSTPVYQYTPGDINDQRAYGG